MSTGAPGEDPPEVLLVVEQLRRSVPGGIGTYARGLLAGLDAFTASRAVCDLYASAPAQRPDPLAALGHRVVTSPFPGKVAPRLWERGIGRAPGGYDVVHATSTAFPPTRAPLVVTVHDLAWRAFPDTVAPRARRWHERALRRVEVSAARVVVPSLPVARALVEGDGFSPERVVVIEEGGDHLAPPDLTATAALLDRLGVEGDFLLSVGTLEPRKNLSRLIAAYGIARAAGLKLPLLVVGPHGWGPRLVPAPGVVLAGAVSDAVLAGLYRRATLFVYVPLLEGFGLPVAEAMASGTPVVSSEVPAAGGASRLVAPDAPGEIADALLQLCGDEEARARLVAAGRVRASSLTWARAAEAHLALWRAVAGGAR